VAAVRHAGDPVDVDPSRNALLFVGLGETGFCPARIDGLTVVGHEVHMRSGHPDDDRVSPDEDLNHCTADCNPRTLAIAVPKERLAVRGFVLRGCPQTLR
jgi:hypothetical protein